MKPRAIIILVLGIVSLCTIIGYQALKSSKSGSQTSSSDTSVSQPLDYSSHSQDTSSDSSSSSGGEELNKQGERRPSQYVHICDTDNNIEYVSQGSPECLGSDTYDSDYGPSVAGTVFSSPCKTKGSAPRYVYISNDETCPNGTTLIFYNSLGGSTSGPSKNSTSPSVITN